VADEWREELFCVLGGATNHVGCQSLIVGPWPITCIALSTGADGYDGRRDRKDQIQSSLRVGHSSGGVGVSIGRRLRGILGEPIELEAVRATSVTSRNITGHNRIKTSCASGFADMRSNGERYVWD